MKTLLLMMLLSTPAFAQTESANAPRDFEVGWNFASYSHQGSVGLIGGDLSLTVNLNRRIGLVVDAAIAQTWDPAVNLRISSVRYGPKITVYQGKRVRVFSEFLAGVSQLSASASTSAFGTTFSASRSQHGVAAAIGTGVDIGIRPWLAIRAPQIDTSVLYFSKDDILSLGYRVGGGLVFRFGK